MGPLSKKPNWQDIGRDLKKRFIWKMLEKSKTHLVEDRKIKNFQKIILLLDEY